MTAAIPPELREWSEQLAATDPEVARCLRSLATANEDEAAREALLDDLDAALTPETYGKALPFMLRLIGAPGSPARSRLLELVNGPLGRVSTDVDERDDDENATMAAFAGLTEQVAALLADDDRLVRARAARTLAILDDPLAAQALLRTLKTEADPMVRASVFIGMCNIGDAFEAEYEAALATDAARDDVAGFAARTTQAIRAGEQAPKALADRLLEDAKDVVAHDAPLTETSWPTSGVDALGTALNAVGVGPAHGPVLAARLAQLVPDQVPGVLSTAIWLAIDENFTPELGQVFTALCDNDKFWSETMAQAIKPVLDKFGLPTDREALAEIVRHHAD